MRSRVTLRMAVAVFSWFSEFQDPGARKLKQIGTSSEYKALVGCCYFQPTSATTPKTAMKEAP